jgi:hypothetical protein
MHGARWLGLKLKIGDHEIPERSLKFVTLYPATSSVAFAGFFIGEQGHKRGAEFRRPAEMRAIPFEVVDRNDVGSTGICDIKDLKLDVGVSPVIKFSGRLVRPFGD